MDQAALHLYVCDTLKRSEACTDYNGLFNVYQGIHILVLLLLTQQH